MKIMLAMSGGVDSSYTAYMLRNQGFELSGVYMKLHNRANYHEQNIENIQKVCDWLDISYSVYDLKDEFNDKVFMPFIKTYKDGKTPNPCALCNRFIKLGALLEYAKNNGSILATGHYAIIENNLIKKAVDLKKDQSYFLANISKNSLKDVIFPLGKLYKNDIKENALKIPMLKAISEQKESSEICFVEDDYTNILKQYYEVEKKGFVKNLKGEIVGEHNGYMNYTIGKRRGFSVKGALKPHYVLSIDAKNNEIIVGSKEDLFIKEFYLENINEFCDFNDLDCNVKIRYNTTEVPCRLIKDEKKVILKDSVYALAKGQLAVFYKDDYVIASGFIR